jgi:hypothetical protein
MIAQCIVTVDTEALSQQTVVQLHRVGARLTVYRSADGQPDRATAFAKRLALFLDAPLRTNDGTMPEED